MEEVCPCLLCKFADCSGRNSTGRGRGGGMAGVQSLSTGSYFHPDSIHKICDDDIRHQNASSTLLGHSRITAYILTEVFLVRKKTWRQILGFVLFVQTFIELLFYKCFTYITSFNLQQQYEVGSLAYECENQGFRARKEQRQDVNPSSLSPVHHTASL